MGRPRKTPVSLSDSTSMSPTPEETPAAVTDSPPASLPPGKRARLVSETGSTGSDGQPRKRGRKSKAVIAEEVEAKRVKLTKIGSNRGCGLKHGNRHFHSLGCYPVGGIKVAGIIRV